MITEVSARDLGTFRDRWTFFRWQTIYDMTSPETPSTRIGIFFIFSPFYISLPSTRKRRFSQTVPKKEFFTETPASRFRVDGPGNKGFFDTMMSYIIQHMP